MAKNSGGVRWHLDEGVLQLKINLHFTGKRDYTIKWTNADGTTGAKSTGDIAKGTYLEWDVLQNAGLSEEQAKKVRSIEILNTKSSGGARIYDMYVRIPDTSASSVNTVKRTSQQECVMKLMDNGRIVIMKNGQRYNVQGQIVK